MALIPEQIVLSKKDFDNIGQNIFNGYIFDMVVHGVPHKQALKRAVAFELNQHIDTSWKYSQPNYKVLPLEKIEYKLVPRKGGGAFGLSHSQYNKVRVRVTKPTTKAKKNAGNKKATK